MTKDFEDIDNEKLGLFLEGSLPVNEQVKITNAVKTYKDLWSLAELYQSCADNRKI